VLPNLVLAWCLRNVHPLVCGATNREHPSHTIVNNSSCSDCKTWSSILGSAPIPRGLVERVLISGNQTMNDEYILKSWTWAAEPVAFIFPEASAAA